MPPPPSSPPGTIHIHQILSALSPGIPVLVPLPRPLISLANPIYIVTEQYQSRLHRTFPLKAITQKASQVKWWILTISFILHYSYFMVRELGITCNIDTYIVIIIIVNMRTALYKWWGCLLHWLILGRLDLSHGRLVQEHRSSRMWVCPNSWSKLLSTEWTLWSLVSVTVCETSCLEPKQK